MIKLIFLVAYSMIGLFLAEVIPSEPLIAEQWISFGLWVGVMISIATIGIMAFKSIWLRDGFAGINKILEDHEAIKFLASIMAFIFLEVFVGLIATEFSGKYPHPSYEFYLAFSGCAGTAGVAIVEKVRGMVKKNENYHA